jgi:drug/metabolite transporter (DMT)-like permease
VGAVLLGLLAGALFGAMTVAVRIGLVRGGDPAVGSLVIASTATGVALALAAPSALSTGIALGELWPFLAIGFIVPGWSQILFILAVRYAGASRAAILIGTAPLGSVLLALAFLDEPLRPALLLGTALIVAGGAALALDRGRPAGFRALGVMLALGCAALFAVRDNAVRWSAREVEPPALQASATSLLAAAVATAIYVVLTRRTDARRLARTAAPAFAPAGVLLACAYGALVAGFARGDVAVVAPLNATQSLWGVAFAVLVYGRTSEAVGRRTLAAGVLIVLGGALIGTFR